MTASDLNSLLCGSAILIATILLMCAVISRTGPLRLTSRGLDILRAIGYLLSDMWAAAWYRRERWIEHLERARRER